MREHERRYQEARAAKEREQAAGAGPIMKRPTYDGGFVGLQPRPWCQVLERAFGVPAEDCLFAVSRETIYAVVADPKRRRLVGSVLRESVRREIAQALSDASWGPTLLFPQSQRTVSARLGVSSRRVVLLAVPRRRFEAALAAQRMGGDAAALAVLKPGATPALTSAAKEYAEDPT